MCVCIYIYKSPIYFLSYIYIHMGWLRIVGSLKSYVSFAKKPYKRDYILQKRPINLRILRFVATPYIYVYVYIHVSTCVRVQMYIYIYIRVREGRVPTPKKTASWGGYHTFKFCWVLVCVCCSVCRSVSPCVAERCVVLWCLRCVAGCSRGLKGPLHPLSIAVMG